MNIVVHWYSCVVQIELFINWLLLVMYDTDRKLLAFSLSSLSVIDTWYNLDTESNHASDTPSECYIYVKIYV